MTEKAVCPHCSEHIDVDVDWKILQTRKKPPTLTDDFDKGATCSECGEKFACKLDTPY